MVARCYIASVKCLLRLIVIPVLVLALLKALPTDAGQQRVWGYVAWWLPDGWKALALQNFERLVFFQIEIGLDGTLDDRHGWPEQWTALSTAAANSEVALDLGLTLQEPAAFNALFSSGVATQRLLADALALASQPGVSGLHLDVEVDANAGLRREAITRFREFVVRLKQGLRQQSPPRALTVFLPFGNFAAIYDAPTLAEVDHAVLQGYDAHFLDSTQAGPVSPLAGDDYLTWEKMLAQADKLRLGRAKMVMSFPLYGYEWTVPSCTPRGSSVGSGESTTLLPMDAAILPLLQINISDRVQRHGAQVEAASGSLYYRFVGASGVCRVGWFEDTFSLAAKSIWIEQQNLHGMAFFPLGYDQGVLSGIQLNRWRR